MAQRERGSPVATASPKTSPSVASAERERRRSHRRPPFLPTWGSHRDPPRPSCMRRICVQIEIFIYSVSAHVHVCTHVRANCLPRHVRSPLGTRPWAGCPERAQRNTQAAPAVGAKPCSWGGAAVCAQRSPSSRPCREGRCQGAFLEEAASKLRSVQGLSRVEEQAEKATRGPRRET